jgi:16S rRNA (cytosine1402-N4)-methyltransferase
MSSNYHIPALVKESVDGLNIQPDGTYVDATFGGGGHSRLILSKLSPAGKLYGFDHDEDAEANVPDNPQFVFVKSNFAYLANFMDWYGVSRIDGLLADLGVSFHHFDDAARGFSFRQNSPLDMRMNRRATKTAADILNKATEDELADIFFMYGELRNARKIACSLVKHRRSKPVTTVRDLLEFLTPFLERGREKKDLACAFQALRIEVNGEMSALKALITQAGALLKPGGRMAIISYHSLEDRMVKNYARSGNFEGIMEQDLFGNVHIPFKRINCKVIVPSAKEIAANPRCRSAKLRIVEKKTAL